MPWDLLGHEWAANLLKKHLSRGEMRHAYLFSGPPGIGRRSLALAFAQAVNCTQPTTLAEPCGVCRICKGTLSLQQTDLSMVEPETDGGMIKVDQIRALQRSLSLSPYEAKYRIALLLNFQRANPNAQNALLKTLEEAPKQVILLITADSPENLLPTIASRCEILRLRPVAIETLESALISRWTLPTDQARLLAHISNGRTGLAFKMLKEPELLEKRSAWVNEFLRTIPLNLRDRFASVEGLTRSRDHLRLVLQTWLSLCRDMLLCQNQQLNHLTNQDFESEIAGFAGSLSHRQVVEMMKSIDRALEWLELNANLRLLVENLYLETPTLR
jgi:DNA polymerase-3 subunit delta'